MILMIDSERVCMCVYMERKEKKREGERERLTVRNRKLLCVVGICRINCVCSSF